MIFEIDVSEVDSEIQKKVDRMNIFLTYIRNWIRGNLIGDQVFGCPLFAWSFFMQDQSHLPVRVGPAFFMLKN